MEGIQHKLNRFLVSAVFHGNGSVKLVDPDSAHARLRRQFGKTGDIDSPSNFGALGLSVRDGSTWTIPDELMRGCDNDSLASIMESHPSIESEHVMSEPTNSADTVEAMEEPFDTKIQERFSRPHVLAQVRSVREPCGRCPVSQGGAFAPQDIRVSWELALARASSCLR